MSEKVIDTKNAPYFLLILVPAALAMSTIFVAWRQILAGTAILIGVSIYQLKKWADKVKSIDPFFQRLIVQNRGEITPIDLSFNANISGAQATRYLAEKAQEFGAGSRQYVDRGQVYYFISVSTLGSIFDDSEDPEIVPAIAATQTASISLPAAEIAPPEIEIEMEIPPITPSASISLPEYPVTEPTVIESSNLRDVLENLEDLPTPITTSHLPESTIDRPIVKIIQSELAKRLDVHSSTIYKRRSEPDFTDWTRNRDPEGLAWAYAEDSKEYYRVDT
jgi:hypothetical protein